MNAMFSENASVVKDIKEASVTNAKLDILKMDPEHARVRIFYVHILIRYVVCRSEQSFLLEKVRLKMFETVFSL